MLAQRLILGASGLLGREIFRAFGEEGTIGTYSAAKSSGLRKFNALTDDTDRLLADLAPGSPVFVLMGVTEIDQCARAPIASNALNLEATIQLIQRVIEFGLLPVYISSDSVFDGETGEYGEEDQTNPLHLYGRQKLEVERFLLGSGKQHLILRLPKVVSALPEKGTLFTDWLEAIRRGEKIRCAEDQLFSPILLSDVSRAIVSLIDTKRLGLFHLAGPESWSRAGLFELLANRLGITTNLMERCSICDFPEFLEVRPLNCTLKIDKIKAELGTDFSLTSMESVCATIAGTIQYYPPLIRNR
ncbi:MAG: sugar nucleotide-binding protein [Pseudomonadota bacterium]|nr:sugar nucleotide-binding protein [Pseudomonadota bacterium]